MDTKEKDLELELASREDLVQLAKQWMEGCPKSGKASAELVAEFMVTTMLMVEAVSNGKATWKERALVLRATLSGDDHNALSKGNGWLITRLKLIEDFPSAMATEVAYPLIIAAYKLDGRIIDAR